MRVLFASSEIYPLTKTGGLADVSAALPKALAGMGVDMHLVMPAYPRAIECAANKCVAVEIGDFMDAGPVRLISGRSPDSALPIWLVDCPTLFRRPGGPYQDQHGQDWPDNLKRFALFSQIVAGLARGQLVDGFRADLLHANDWHTGLAPAILATEEGSNPATIFTLHNLAYQGVFPASAQGDSGPLPDRLDPNTFEFYGQISLLKAGISWSDRLTTVSPTYAREILTPEYGCGLDGLLRHRSNDLLGILNGADYHVWDPGSDALIPASFTVRNPAGKRFCKAALQAEFGLNQDADTPIVAFMSRVSDQKMADVVAQSLADIADMGAQCVILGDGDRRISDEFDRVAQRHAGRVSARTGYEETLAHLVLAGGDILLHPARFEPCGLTQLYAMRYGTLPVVRSTGGLSDTVVDAGDEAITNGTATGFAFAPPERGPMLACLGRAIEFYQQPLAWRRVQRHAMAQDFSWEKSARRYLALYRTLVSGFEPDCAAAPEVVLEKAAG